MELAGPLGTLLGLAQWKRASSRGEAGTSGCLPVSDSDLRVLAELGQESQASSHLRKGAPLASRVVQWVSGPSLSCVWNLRVFPDDAWECQCPFVLCLPPQVCLRRGVQASGSSQEWTGKSGRSACGTTRVTRLEFPPETGLIPRCAGKAGNHFQTTQGNRLSCRYQEGRRGSDEVVPGHSVFPSREPGMSGNFWMSHEGCQVPFRTSGRNMGIPWRHRSGQGPHLAKRWNQAVFLELRRDSRVTTGISGFLLCWPWEAQSSPRVARESCGLRSSHGRAKKTSSRRVSRT